MFDFFKAGSEPLVGIDISSSTVKVLELSQSNGQYVVETYGSELLPPQSIKERNIQDIEAVAQSIRKLVKRLGIARNCAAIAVSGPAVITRQIQLETGLKDDQIAEQIEVDAGRHFPLPIEEIYYDFEVMGPVVENPEMTNIFLAACRMDTIDLKVAAVTEAGLKVSVVDIEVLAVEHAFQLATTHFPAKGQGLNFALFDIGASNTTLYVIRDFHTIYTRDLTFGGRHLTDEIQKRYSLSVEEAIVAQRYGGLPEDYTAEVLEPFKESVVLQINRALQTLFSTIDESEVHYIALAGGVAMLPGLDALIQNKLKIKTFIVDPFLGMQFSPKVNKNSIHEDASGFLVACGLALRTFKNE